MKLSIAVAGTSATASFAVVASDSATVEKSQRALKKLSTQYDNLNDRLDKLVKLQKRKQTPERKAKIDELKKKLKENAKDYSTHLKVVTKASAKVRKADPKRAEYVDKVDFAEQHLKSIRSNREGGAGAARAESAQKKLDSAKAALEKYDARMKKKSV